MIHIGQRIKVVIAHARPYWRIGLEGMAYTIYEYVPIEGRDYVPHSPSVVTTITSDPMTVYPNYNSKIFRMGKDPNLISSSYKEVERIASFVIDTFYNELMVFVFPKTVAQKIRRLSDGEDPKKFEWGIDRSGEHINTKYEVKRFRLPRIRDIERSLINDTLELVSMEAVLFKGPQYVQMKYTSYDRFEIMDMD